MKRLIPISISLLLSVTAAMAQTYNLSEPQPVYDDKTGYGWDVTKAPTEKELKKGVARALFFSVKVPGGNYRVTVVVGSKKRAASTVLRAENRRLFVEQCDTRKGEQKTFSFVVNKRSPYINDKLSVRIKEREKDYFNWDDRLTLEFNGSAPAVSEVRIERDDNVPTVFLCGNSTVVDQMCEPWASWGQMFPRWFDEGIAISNHAESGLTAGSFLAGNRLEKILSMMKPGDYVLCEFGHNDQKEKSPGSGAWYNFSYNLKKFVDQVRKAKGNIIFLTPTQRRNFKDGKIQETHGDYPDAMRAVAKREGVPVIELHDMTRTFFETLGVEDSKRALVHYPAGTFPGQDKEFADNTHFNTWGAYEVSKMVVMGMKQLALPILSHLRADWQDYSPSAPDDFNTWMWCPSPIYENVKPDGN